MNALQAISAIRNATRDAKSRTGDERISTEVEQGQFRVVLVDYRDDGGSDVAPLTGWLSPSATVEYLNGYGS